MLEGRANRIFNIGVLNTGIWEAFLGRKRNTEEGHLTQLRA